MTSTNRLLPPGQHAIDGFPRFGTHLHMPPPDVPPNPTIELGGAMTPTAAFEVAGLMRLPRRELTADLHCVAGWTAPDLKWEGVMFDAFYEHIIAPHVTPGSVITHLLFSGLDGHQSVVQFEDAVNADVIIADTLNGRPLGGDHGAPARLVSPSQYGYMSTKHLARIEAHTARPTAHPGNATALADIMLRGPVIQRHPRARVWEEERHPVLPAWTTRVLGRALTAPGILLSYSGRRK